MRCAVLGSPIGHSLSPVLHRTAYDVAGLDWTYDAEEVTEAGLAGFLDGLDASWRGLSLTMPLKRAVVPLVDELTGEARLAQAANTVILDGGRRIGHNTDIPGAVAALTERYDGPVNTAIVLGGGATASSALLALTELGCTAAQIVVRDPSRVRETLDAVARHSRPPAVEVVRFAELDRVGAEGADVLVSTIPASAQTAPVVSLAETSRVAFDVVYDPWPTPLTAFAAARGSVFVSGLDLLVHQAALQFTLMTRISSAPLAQMREAGSRVLQAT